MTDRFSHTFGRRSIYCIILYSKSSRMSSFSIWFSMHDTDKSNASSFQGSPIVDFRLWWMEEIYSEIVPHSSTERKNAHSRSPGRESATVQVRHLWLPCQIFRNFREYEGFFGHYFIWCLLQNFGGSTLMRGNLGKLHEVFEVQMSSQHPCVLDLSRCADFGIIDGWNGIDDGGNQSELRCVSVHDRSGLDWEGTLPSWMVGIWAFGRIITSGWHFFVFAANPIAPNLVAI